jgi:hypothetical protein
MRTLLETVGIPAPRVRELVAHLGIDKSTASRVVRGLRATDPVTSLREFPSGEGLRSVVAACQQHGVTDADARRAKLCIAALESQIRSLPGGRAGLATVLVGATPNRSGDRTIASSVSRERAARRAAFNSQCYLQGIWVEAAVHGWFLHPGTAPGRAHQAMMNATVGLRRLRTGPPITVGGVYGSPLNETAPTRICLDGRPIGDDPTSALLREFCDGPVDRLRAEKNDRAYILWMDSRDPPLDTPATIALGMKYLDFIETHKSDRFHFAATTYTIRRPTRLLVIEVLVHADLVGLGGPSLHITLLPQSLPDPIGGPPRNRREILDTNAAFVPMGRGFSRPGTPHSDTYLPMLQHAMRELGWDPRDFERHRLEIEYPLAFVGTQVWFELQESPPSAGGTTSRIS